jgi:DNA-directed RNA polymerase specialized sigma24 family protein
MRSSQRVADIDFFERFFDQACPESSASAAWGLQRLPAESGACVEIYTSTEVLAAIRALTVQQKSRLMKIAKARARNAAYGPEDLIQEACMRVLDGTRKWPRDVPVLTFLAGVMRSIAWDWRPKVGDEDVDVDGLGAEDNTAAARIDFQKIIALFNDDPVAQKMVLALMDGAKGEELRELSGLTSTEYESKRTKIRRRLEKAWS